MAANRIKGITIEIGGDTTKLQTVPSVAGCDEIEVAKIRPFKDHPFKVLDDEKMHELVESIMLK